MEIYKRLLKYLKFYWKRLVLAMICMWGVGGMTGASAMLVKNVLDDVFINKDENMLKLIPVAIIIIYIFKGIFYFFQSYLMFYVGQSVVKDIRDELYSHIQRQPMSFFAKNPTGTLMSRITYDVNMISSAVSDAFSSLLRDSFTVVILLGVVIFRDWELALIALVVYPFALYPITKFGRKMRKVGTKSQLAMGYITSFLHETIAGARIVKAFGMEQYESERFARANEHFLKLTMKSRKVRALTMPVMEILGAVAASAVIWYGGFKVMEGKMTTGEFFSFLTALMFLYQPVKKLSSVNNVIQEALAAAERIFALLDKEPDIQDSSHAREITGLKERVSFSGVHFCYDDENVIDGFDLEVKKGERIAFVGSSGAGKTTLVNLIPRFYDVTGGGIFIDGEDIRNVTLPSLRDLIAIVSQETILFNDTVRNNIAYGKKETSHEAVIRAARAAFAHDFIMELPEGYNTEVGEQGVRLSGGQRQRLSIARALLKNAPMLILDEATSALDTESEQLVQQALDNLMKDRTSFVIAHRLSTVVKADRIVVLHKGRLAEEGKHEELLKSGGLYAKLWDRQFADI
ncbi:MAG: lipid A export permease/ATP-binding protein MsbA [Deltaproteobacteria bacterium]|nr:lipid A export permease/ATP-binding protein MsbA [Deltaproteobacteria bacterium]